MNTVSRLLASFQVRCDDGATRVFTPFSFDATGIPVDAGQQMAWDHIKNSPLMRESDIVPGSVNWDGKNIAGFKHISGNTFQAY